MAKHRQISKKIRERILRGELVPGEVLPTTQELGEEFGTSVFTVQTALAPLVSEGLLERKRRAGTVVCHNPAVLTCAGIYCSTGMLDEWEFAFFREMCRQLVRQLGEQNVSSVLHADMRPHEEQHRPLPALAEAIEEHRIQGLLVPLCDQASAPWLTRLPVASSFTSWGVQPNRVGSDAGQLVRLAVDRLHQKGCKRIGLISNIRVPGDSGSEPFRFYDAFISRIGELGLKTHNDWVKTPDGPLRGLEDYGYRAFRTLWQRDERPEGLLVFPDTAARGVMTAAFEMGVRVPQDVHLVFHRNTGVDWTCPLEVDWLESDVALWAAAMIDQVRRQKAGGEVHPVSLPYQLHKGC